MKPLGRLDDWWTDEDTLDPPPTVALAALFSLAARRARYGRQGGQQLYGQLKDLLRLDEQELAKVYRLPKFTRLWNRSRYLWTSINEWSS